MSIQQIIVIGYSYNGLNNLVLNIENLTYNVSIFNHSIEKTNELISLNPERNLIPYYST